MQANDSGIPCRPVRQADGAGQGEDKRHIPGEAAVWIFILGDMLIFGLLFLTFLYYRNIDRSAFAVGRDHLNVDLGVFNTLLLLTSSWLVAVAVQKARSGAIGSVQRLILGAIICGCGFVVVKIFEYWEKIQGGIELLTSDFFMFYFVMTGIHLLHLLMGMGFLSFIRARTAPAHWNSGTFSLLETGASFWHLVDLLWIVIFPLLYLV